MTEGDRDDHDHVEGPGADAGDDEVVDQLPADLDATLAVPVTFPNNNRRRIPAVLYLLMGSAAIAVALTRQGSPSVNGGLVVGGGLLVAFAIYGWFAGRTLRIDETEALVATSAAIGFPVGHASAQLAWRGLGSQPVWRLLVYSSENPPARRGMAIVDGVTGEVLECFSEENPEDWG